MPWHKHGRIFDPTGQADWFQSHAALPVVESLSGDRLRVYFSGRDAEGRAQIGYFDLTLDPVPEVSKVSAEPVLGYGQIGTFDDRGVTTGCLVQQGHTRWLYYTGWNLGVTVPFYFYIGAARADGAASSQSFERLSEAPVLGRNASDPYLTASPSILIEEDIWRMWYTSCVRWEQHGDDLRHYYHIRYAESPDGITWQSAGRVCIDFKDSEEYAIARPHVMKRDNSYEMWYSYRGDAYRIGYATSADGLHWTRRDDEAGITVSEVGWDSEMVAYPTVFEHQGRRYMLYNGNGYGRSGIGLASWRD